MNHFLLPTNFDFGFFVHGRITIIDTVRPTEKYTKYKRIKWRFECKSNQNSVQNCKGKHRSKIEPRFELKLAELAMCMLSLKLRSELNGSAR